MTDKKPVIAITMSEAAGIGPEILLKALNHSEIHEICTPVAIGDWRVLKMVSEQLDIPVNFNVIRCFEEADFTNGRVNLIDMDCIPEHSFEPGRPNAVTGQAMLDYTRLAVGLFLDGKVDGAVGGPHSKKAAEEAGEYFDGYPGLIAKITGSPHPFLMLVTEGLCVANATLHTSLRHAIEMLDKDLVLNCIRETNKAMKGFGIDRPRIAVSGLNPHAGENGMFGDEDELYIRTAVESAQAEGIQAAGPFPADSLFYGCMENGKYDAYVAMYHDQAHLPVKVLAFKSSSAVAIGVPVNWATVDHGCALDIAWKGEADENVICNTIELIAKRAASFTRE